MLDGPKQKNVGAVGSPSNYFVANGWMTACDITKSVSQYRTFTMKYCAPLMVFLELIGYISSFRNMRCNVVPNFCK